MIALVTEATSAGASGGETTRERRVTATSDRAAERWRQSGFTLLELLVVLAIIGMLGALIGPRLFERLEGSKVVTAQTQVRMLKTALDTIRCGSTSVVILRPRRGSISWSESRRTRLGTVVGVMDQTGIAQYQFGANTGTVTLSGNFSNIASAYLAPFGTTTCSTTPPGGNFPGTVTGATITFTGIAVPSTLSAVNPNIGELCLTASGTGVIGANGTAPPYAIKTAIVTTTQQSPAVFGLLTYTYNGSVQQVLYTGTFPPYTGFIRITNNTSSAATVVVSVQVETGATGSTTTPVPANNNVLVPASTLITASGVALDPTGRASMVFLTPGTACLNNAGGLTCPVSVSQLLVNPDGTVTQLGSGAAP